MANQEPLKQHNVEVLHDFGYRQIELETTVGYFEETAPLDKYFKSTSAVVKRKKTQRLLLILMSFIVFTLMMVSIFVFQVHNIFMALAIGLSSLVVFVMGYGIVVMVGLFQYFWESLEGD